MRPSELIFGVPMFGGGVTLVGWHTLSEVDPVAPPATARVSIGNVSLTVLASGMRCPQFPRHLPGSVSAA